MSIKPDHGPDLLLDDAERLTAARDFAAAEALCRTMLEAAPRRPDAIALLGWIHLETGRLGSAEALLRRALSLDPDTVRTILVLVTLLARQHRRDEALRYLGTAEILEPRHPDTLLMLGQLLNEAKRYDEAVLRLERLVAITPRHAPAWVALGSAHQNRAEFGAATDAFLRALALDATLVDAWNMLGICLTELERHKDALAAFDRAQALAPDDATQALGRGFALTRARRFEEARAVFDACVRAQPDEVRAIVARGVCSFACGRLEEGWADYDRRFEIITDGLVMRAPLPHWQGEPLDGRRILLVGEQGQGDMLQYCRFAPLVAAAGGQVVLGVTPGLKRLLARVEGVSDVVAAPDRPPKLDLQVPMMSLPRRLGLGLDRIPAKIPYLCADPADLAKFAAVRDIPEFKVGLVWSGAPRPHEPSANITDRRRSMPLAALAPLGQVPGVRFFSLQKGPGAQQLETPPPGLPITDLTAEIDDFADTAALVAQLDLVIAVDTSVIHLAGGMGVPVWMLSRFDACWRWLIDREDTPWYPTMRIFHQNRPGDWAEVMARVVPALAAAIAAA